MCPTWETGGTFRRSRPAAMSSTRESLPIQTPASLPTVWSNPSLANAANLLGTVNPPATKASNRPRLTRTRRTTRLLGPEQTADANAISSWRTAYYRTAPMAAASRRSSTPARSAVAPTAPVAALGNTKLLVNRPRAIILDGHRNGQARALRPARSAPAGVCPASCIRARCSQPHHSSARGGKGLNHPRRQSGRRLTIKDKDERTRRQIPPLA